MDHLARFPWRAAAGFLFAFSPALVLAALVAEHAVNTPMWDDWQRGDLLKKWHEGNLSFRDLYAPHIDHRMVFPRLLTLALNGISGGDLRWEIAATYLIGLGAGLGVWRLAKATVPGWGWPAVFLCNLWIFSPLQYDNWLWAIQASYMLPMTCLVWALLAVIRPSPWLRRFAAAGALALVGTHSFSHGLLIWPAVFFLALLLPRGHPGAAGRLPFLGAWLALAVIVISCYFLIDFRAGSSHSYGQALGDPTPLAKSLSTTLADYGPSWRFTLVMLGTPFARLFAIDPLPAAEAAGPWVLLVYSLCGLWALGQRRKGGDAGRATWAGALPWLALGGVAIATAFAVGLGRSSILALGRATVPRLSSVTLYFPLMLIALSWLMTRRHVHLLPGGAWRGRWAAAAFGILVALQAQPWIYGKGMMELWSASRQQARAQIMFIRHWRPPDPGVIDLEAGGARRHAEFLNERGWLKPSLTDSLRLDQFSISRNALPRSRGAISEVAALDEDGWRLRGHAILRLPSRPADAVLITARGESDETPMILGMAAADGTLRPTRFRSDLQFSKLVELREQGEASWKRWRFELRREALPQGRPLLIQAWALDVEQMRVGRLPGEVRVTASGALEFSE